MTPREESSQMSIWPCVFFFAAKFQRVNKTLMGIRSLLCPNAGEETGEYRNTKNGDPMLANFFAAAFLSMQSCNYVQLHKFNRYPNAYVGQDTIWLDVVNR